MKKLSFISFIAIVFLACIMSSKARADWNSDRIFSSMSGKGNPVIIVPGLTSSPEIFRNSIDQSAKEHSVHWITLGGFGGKPAPKNITVFTQPAANELTRYIKSPIQN